jgi:biopolymer transport protein ExbD
VVVRGPAPSCFIEVDGRKVTTDELLAIARPEVKPGRAARIDADMAQTPYRCIGGAIYTLQMAGFSDVGFAAKPASKR